MVRDMVLWLPSWYRPRQMYLSVVVSAEVPRLHWLPAVSDYLVVSAVMLTMLYKHL